MRRAAFALVCALILASCASAPAATPVDNVDVNGALTETINQVNLKVIDPQALSFTDEVEVANLVFEPLLSLDPVGLRPAPAAAELPKISADGLVYHFTLRPGLTYSDGVPVKASDYAYGISRLCDPALNAAYRGSVRPINGCDKWTSLDIATASPVQLAAARRELFAAGIVVLGDRDLELRLREPAPYLSSVMALWVATPVRQSDVERYGGNWWLDPATYIGNGPFVLAEWVIGSRMVFERNARYRTPAKLKRLTMRMFPDPGQALSAYQAGTIDRITTVSSDLLPSITAAGLEREMAVSPGACTFYVRLNHARPPLDDPKVRLALAKSIDREAYAREIRPFTRPATSFIAAGLPGNDPSDTAQAYDLAAAKQSLTESRYAGTDALRGLVWTLASNQPASRQREIAWIAAQWHTLGIDVRVELVDPPTLAASNRTLATRQLFVSAGWCADYPDQADWLSQWFTSSAQKGAVDFGYRNSTVDALLAEADRGLDQSKRDELYLRASRILSADVAFIWIGYQQSVSLSKPWVGGLNVNAIDWGGAFHPADVFVRTH